jgi:hypothetical protein
MSRRAQLVRLVGSSLCLLVSAVFCQQFSSFQFNALVDGAGFSAQDLPWLCLWLARYSPALLALPLLTLWLGITGLMKREGPSGAVELVAQTALVLALIIVVGCILVWQLPYALLPTESF